MGAVTEFLTADHRRLDALFARAAGGGADWREAYGAFREGLLRHIGFEEMILLPAVAAKPGAPLPLFARLRLDHGALTNLFVPEPTRQVLAAIGAILTPHNRLEEEPGGLYEACDRLLPGEAAALVARMRAARPVPVKPYSKRPQALEAAKRAMTRAGYDWDACVAD